MRPRMLAAAIAAVAAIAPASSFAQHSPPNNTQPSRHCNGATPQTTEVKTRIESKKPAVCFAPQGWFKGAVWVDVATGSVVFDGDSDNGSMNPCLDGYVGFRAQSANGPYILWSQGSNYNPDAGVGDGGTTTTGSGNPNDRFDAASEHSEVTGCVSF